MRKMIVAVLLMCLVLVQPVSAYAQIETGRDASLTIDHVHSGVSFSIYRVADVSDTGRFSLCDAFAQYTDLQPLLEAAEWDEITDILDARVVRDGIRSEDSGATGNGGSLTFSGLKPGLFLVMSEPYRIDNATIYLNTALVCVPGLDSDDAWEYDVVIIPKGHSETDPERPKTNISVQKIWRDEGEREARPDSITVQLLRGNTVVDTVTLSTRNNWRYHWSELPTGHRYRVVETDVPDSYADSYSREGETIIIINTYTEPSHEPEKPVTPDEPNHPGNSDIPSNPGTPSNPDVPNNPGTPANPETPDGPEGPGVEDTPDDHEPVDKPTLPETGQLWWPVLLLTAVGLVFILIGLIRKQEDSNET